MYTAPEWIEAGYPSPKDLVTVLASSECIIFADACCMNADLPEPSERRDEYCSGDAISAWRPGDEVVRNHEARRHESGGLSDACSSTRQQRHKDHDRVGSERLFDTENWGNITRHLRSSIEIVRPSIVLRIDLPEVKHGRIIHVLRDQTFC